MAYADKAKLIGKKATIELHGLTFEVEVLVYKFSYGNDRWLVRPVAGHGERWVQKLNV
jgi:hypothetical protein